MKASRLWVIAAALMAGCVPFTPAPYHMEASAAREKVSAGPPETREVVARVTRRHRMLPEMLEGRELRFDSTGALDLPRLAGRLADALSVEVAVEERVSREDGRTARLGAPAPISVAVTGSVRELLDEVARRSGYEWEWEDGAGPGSGRLIFYRDHDRPRAGRHTPGLGSKEEWRIDPARHGTLRGVLEEWTARAGWTLVWEAEEVDYALHAPAIYLGTFEAAVDALLRETKVQRMLVPTLWRANRYLTVREAG